MGATTSAKAYTNLELQVNTLNHDLNTKSPEDNEFKPEKFKQTAMTQYNMTFNLHELSPDKTAQSSELSTARISS